MAQGGISICQGKSDRAAFIEDTLKAGHYKNNKRAVELLVADSEALLDEAEAALREKGFLALD